ncbi:MAG: hypothetical protein GEU74_13035 [Nitriliruptorales bacterium]|nr:hypothetical protein [Nitriliruptorales bacterium]
MRTLFVSLAAALSALALGAAAIAAQGGPDLEDVAATAVVDDSQEATEKGDAEAEDAEAAEEGDVESDESDDAVSDDGDSEPRVAKSTADETDSEIGVAANEDAFGQVRAAEVHAARDAGETPPPAWQDEAHPTGGPEGEQASAAEPRPATTDDETASDGSDESAEAGTSGSNADEHRADAERRGGNGD